MSKKITAYLLLYAFILISSTSHADPYEDWKITATGGAFLNSRSGDIAVASDDTVHICYTDKTTLDLMYATDSSGSWTITTVNDTSYFTRGCSIDMDSDDSPHLAYCDSSNNELIHAYLILGVWTNTIVESGIDCSRYSGPDNEDIYVDTANRIHISYQDATNEDLKYAVYDPGVGIWSLFTIDSTGDLGSINSISGSDSNTVYIAYSDRTNNTIKLATYTDSSGAWTIETITDVTSAINLYPEIAVGSDDTLHLTFGGGNVEYNTQDIYGAWTNDVIDPSSVISYAIDIAVDDFNNVYIVYVNNVTEALSFRTNAFGGWTEDKTIDSNVGSTTYDADIAIDSFGKVHTSYYDYDAESYLYASNTKGDTDAISAVMGEYSSIGSDDDNIVYISTYDDFNDDLILWTFTPTTGWSSETVDSTGNVGRYNSMVVTADGDIYISYFDDTNTKIKQARKLSGSTTWSKSTIDDSSSTLIGEYTALAIDAAGDLHASYYDRTNGNLVYATKASGSWVATTVDTAGDVGRYTSIAVGDTGRVHICYYDQTNSRLRYAYKNSGSATWNKRNVGSDNGKYCDITTDGNNGNIPWISYYDADTADQNLRFVRISETGSTATTTVDSTGVVGLYTSIDTDDFNRPLISYYDSTNGNLKLARRDNLGTWEVKTISESSNVGSFTAINIDVHNHAHVAHQDILSGHLNHSYY